MNWKNEAANDLSNYGRKVESLENIREQIDILKSQFTSIKGATTDQAPVMGGTSHHEDQLINNIVKRQRLVENYRVTQRQIRLIERGMAGLDEKEKLVLDRFYINRARGHVDQLMDELNYEKTAVYELKDRALHKFTVTLYGIIEC